MRRIFENRSKESLEVASNSQSFPYLPSISEMPEKRSKSPWKMKPIEVAKLVSQSIKEKPSLKDKVKKSKEKVARLKYLADQHNARRDERMLRDIEDHKAQVEMER